MSGYATYRYTGARPSTAQRESGNWSNFLESRLQQIAPVAGTPAMARSTDLVQLPVSPRAFLWNAILMGYGLPGNYVSLFLLRGKRMKSHEEEDFRNWIRTRAAVIAASHEIFVWNGVTYVARKDIYPLIESSEVASPSYLIGNAFAQICVPAHLQEKIEHKAVLAPILYHASLLKASAAIGISIKYTGASTIDLIAFDNSYEMHFVEAKGDDGIYSAWIKSIYQCMGVAGCSIDGKHWRAPASLTSSVAFEAKQRVSSGGTDIYGGIRAVLTDIPLWPAGTQQLKTKLLKAGMPSQAGPFASDDQDQAGRKRVAYALAGFRLLSTCLVMNTLSSDSEGEWTTSRFATEAAEYGRLQAAIPKFFLNLARDFEERSPWFIPAGIELQIALASLGRRALAWREASDLVPPKGFGWTASDPFVALPILGQEQ